MRNIVCVQYTVSNCKGYFNMDKNGKDKRPFGADSAPHDRAQKNNYSSTNKNRNKKYSSGKPYQKNGKGPRTEKAAGDSAEIKTIADNEYIPFGNEYDDDDIIPIDSEYKSYGKNGFAEKKRYGSNSRDRRQEKSNTQRRESEGMPGAVVGRNAVRELLKSGRSIDKLYVKTGVREGSIVVIVAEAVNRKIPIVEASAEKLDLLAGGPHHQGVVALAAEKQYTDIETILKTAKDRGETPLVVIADGIEDPQNLGALIRCAECAGAHGIIIPKRRASGLTPIVTKASAGAIEHMNIARVSNLADAIEKLKKAGLWVFAAEAGGTPYYETDFNVPAAVVLGSEVFGVGKLLKERADFTVSIPMYGQVNSLNVSTAASVILCHAARMQREGKN